MKWLFQLFNKEIAIQIKWRDLRLNPVKGYTNRCLDGFYIITLDYDFNDLEWVEEELKRIQEDFIKGNFYIFKSLNGYHAICVDKGTLQEFKEIATYSSIDPRYLLVPLRYGEKVWCLRTSPKENEEIKFVKIVKSKYEGMNKRSKPHIKYLNNIFGLSIPFDNCDNQKYMIEARYQI